MFSIIIFQSILGNLFLSLSNKFNNYFPHINNNNNSPFGESIFFFLPLPSRTDLSMAADVLLRASWRKRVSRSFRQRFMKTRPHNGREKKEREKRQWCFFPRVLRNVHLNKRVSREIRARSPSPSPIQNRYKHCSAHDYKIAYIRRGMHRSTAVTQSPAAIYTY